MKQSRVRLQILCQGRPLHWRHRLLVIAIVIVIASVSYKGFKGVEASLRGPRVLLTVMFHAQGSKCQTPVAVCDAVLWCANGGICDRSAVANRTICMCPSTHSGLNCETLIEPQEFGESQTGRTDKHWPGLRKAGVGGCEGGTQYCMRCFRNGVRVAKGPHRHAVGLPSFGVQCLLRCLLWAALTAVQIGCRRRRRRRYALPSVTICASLSLTLDLCLRLQYLNVLFGVMAGLLLVWAGALFVVHYPNFQKGGAVKLGKMRPLQVSDRELVEEAMCHTLGSQPRSGEGSMGVEVVVVEGVPRGDLKLMRLEGTRIGG